MTQAGPLLADVTGIILAGGRSARFGSDKLTAELDGRSMLQRAVDAVAAVAPLIVVVQAPGAASPQFSLPGSRLEIVNDAAPFEGPLSALAAGLAAVGTPVALVAGGDMPWMVPAVLQLLATTVGPDQPAVNLEVPTRVQPLPMALAVDPARVAVAALLVAGERSLRALLRELGGTAVPAPLWRSLDPAGDTVLDIDRPSDLQQRP